MNETRHHRPTPTLRGVFHDEGVREFDGSLREALGKASLIDYTVEPAIRGVEVELVYIDGVLSVASTRGDEYRGEEITSQIKTLLTVPLTLVEWEGGKPVPHLLEVRAQVYMELEALDSLNGVRGRQGLPPFQNPQDAAADSLMQADLRVTARRPLNLFCNGVGLVSGPGPGTRYERMVTLQEWGLRVNRPHIRVCHTIEEVIDHCHRLKDTRNRFPYEIEGALIQVNGLDLQAGLGEDSGSPAWALLYRFVFHQGA